MRTFKVRTRYTCEDVYKVIADSAQEAEQLVMEGYHDYPPQVDEETSYKDETIVETVEIGGTD